MNPVIVGVIAIGAACTGLMYACLAAVSSKYSKYEEEEDLIMAEEKRFENRIKAFLKEQGCWYVKYWAGGGYTRAGIPDLLICCNGRFLGVEVKASTGRPSELQKAELNHIQQAGGIGMIVYPDDFENFKKLIIKIKEGKIC